MYHLFTELCKTFTHMKSRDLHKDITLHSVKWQHSQADIFTNIKSKAK